MPSKKKIRLIIAPDYGYSRDLVKGIRKFAAHGNHWQIFFSSFSDIELTREFHGPVCDGAIAIAGAERVDQALRNLGIPVVNASSRSEQLSFPSVIQDNAAIGELAAEHLLERGFTRFAVVTYDGMRFSRERVEGFAQKLQPLGYPLEHISMHAIHDLERLRALEPPVGIFAVSDTLAIRVIQSLLMAKRRVPHEAAVVGVDNDDLMCDLAEVPLSSIDPGGERIGYEAADLLHRLLQGQEPAPTEPIRVPPSGVVERMSTHVMAVDDPLLVQVMEYIHEHACKRMSIDELTEGLDVSRRTLEVRFKRRFGHTLHDEIRRVQMRLARRLLQDTDIPVPEVAKRCGFGDYTRFISVFGSVAGTSPGRYRKHYRLKV